jgi:putative endonuclease
VSPDERQILGAAGEQAALDHLERLGFRLVARNHRTRHGELDLVVCDERTLVFAEVKTRRAGPGARDPLLSLHERKRAQVRRMAGAFLADVPSRPRRPELRFDAIAVTLDAAGALVRLDHLEGAF